MAAYFNLSTHAWRQAVRSWDLPSSPSLMAQTYLKGGLQTLAGIIQAGIAGRRRQAAPIKGAVFILGFWRSGTSLLHELLCADKRFGYPTTWSCLNPHHFLLTEKKVLALEGVGAKRPQDKMVLRASTPQEDEFGLFLLGARSPYEGLLAPREFEQALCLADPADLRPKETRHWQTIFLKFLQGISLVNGGKPLVLKSPTHSYRVPMLRELLPDARFVLIVRNPFEVFESTVRTYRTLTDKYSIGPGLSDNELRQLILTERLRFESKLENGIENLPKNKLAIVRYEDLLADPLSVLEQLYTRLELPEFDHARSQIDADIARRVGYAAEAALPDKLWTRRITEQWAGIFRRYGYSLQTGQSLGVPICDPSIVPLAMTSKRRKPKLQSAV